jgi:muramoyltetrapeptide carboxypeptidase
MNPVLKPRALCRGDVVGIVAPAGAVWESVRIDHAVRYLEGRGYRVEVGAHARGNDGAFAASDADRLADLNAMLRDPRIRAVFAARGGYGSARLLEGIDYAAVRRDPKILVGYSDITALQLGLWRRTGLVSFSGPLAAVEFAAGPDPYTEEQFWRLVTSSKVPGRLEMPAGTSPFTACGGKAEGVLLGGCLSLVASLLGTRFSPNYAGSILFLEDVHEHIHRIDRLLFQLRLAGVLRKASGIVLGEFTGATAAVPARPSHTLAESVESALAGLGVPRISGFPYGHIPRKATLPVGLQARLDADRGSLELMEPAVAG